MKKVILFCSLLCSATTTLNAQPDWYWQNPLPQGNLLNDIHLFDEFSGIAVGGFGTIVLTTDGGSTWMSQSIEAYALYGSISIRDYLLAINLFLVPAYLCSIESFTAIIGFNS